MVKGGVSQTTPSVEFAKSTDSSSLEFRSVFRMQPYCGAVCQHDPQQRCKGENLPVTWFTHQLPHISDELCQVMAAFLLQETVYETLHALCQRLPKEQVSECDLQIKTYFPKVLQQTPGQQVSSSNSQSCETVTSPPIYSFNVNSYVLPQKPGDTCKLFGLCRSSKEEPLPLPRATDENTPSSALGSADRRHVSVWKQKSKVNWNLFRLYK